MNRVFDRLTYEQLPTTTNVNSVYKAATANRRRIFIAGAGLISLVSLVILLSWLLGPYWHPLDSYQILNHNPISFPTSLSSSSNHERAIVTTLYSNNYVTAVAVLGQSIRQHSLSADLILLYIASAVSEEALCIARTVGWKTIPVARIPPPHNGHGIASRFKDQYTKLNIWALDEQGIKAAVYLDADTLVRSNFDELFTLPFGLAVVPDVWEDKRGFTTMFNAGVLSFRPNSTVLRQMMSVLEDAKYDFTDAEQSFLNLYWGAKALRLPYAYNANVVIKRRNVVLWNELKSDARIVHYTVSKPFTFRHSTDHIPLHEDTLKGLREAREREGGKWREEMSWWADVYHSFWTDHSHEVGECHMLTS